MSRFIKYILIGLILAAPKFALGATATFADKSWDLNPAATFVPQTAIIKNNFSLKVLVNHSLLNKPLTVTIATFDDATISTITEIQTSINHPTVNAQMNVQDNWATTFIPDQTGQAVDTNALILDLAENLDQIQIPVVIAEPEVKLADLNSLGINELVAEGVSDFSGSSKNRITNVSVGSGKYQGLIIQPGEEFSFNKYLGEIDAAHGFKPEQVIKASGIELEFGGGLCQVSSTMFRAAMNAGLPITQRRNHSFAVHYYSPQGTDATIYPGSSDLKFINDYSTPILITTHIEGVHLYFDMYGTKDGREVTFEGPVQFDKKPDGSMKATWTRHVTKNGEITTYIAKSTYVSPSLFKKVDQTATPNPQAVPTPVNQPVPTQPNT